MQLKGSHMNSWVFLSYFSYLVRPTGVCTTTQHTLSDQHFYLFSAFQFSELKIQT